MSRSSSISSESSVKSLKAKSLPPNRKPATERSKTATKSSQRTKPATTSSPATQAKAKKLFPRNPIQNLIKFYESTEKAEDRDDNSNNIQGCTFTEIFFLILLYSMIHFCVPIMRICSYLLRLQINFIIKFWRKILEKKMCSLKICEKVPVVLEDKYNRVLFR